MRNLKASSGIRRRNCRRLPPHLFDRTQCRAGEQPPRTGHQQDSDRPYSGHHSEQPLESLVHIAQRRTNNQNAVRGLLYGNRQQPDRIVEAFELLNVLDLPTDK